MLFRSGQIFATGAGVTIPNNLTLSGIGPTETAGFLPYGALRPEAGAVISGNIVLSGATTRIGTIIGIGTISGTITGDANSTFEKYGAGTIALTAASNPAFPAKTRVDGGYLQIATAATIGPVPGTTTADALTLLNGGRIVGGTPTAGADLVIAANRGVTLSAGNGGFAAPTGFTTTVSSAITGPGGLISGAPTANLYGGTVVFNGPAITAAGQFVGQLGSTTLSVPSATFLNMNIGDGATNAHTVNQTTGNIVSTNQFFLGHWATETSRYNISAGSLSLPDTVTTPTSEAQANLFLGIDGSGILTISGTGVVNTSSLVINGRSEVHHRITDTTVTPNTFTTVDPDTLNLNGGRLNIGRFGIRTQGTTYQANLGSGTLGAYGDWSSSLRFTFNGTTGDTIINTLDSVDNTTARTVTLSGVLDGFTGGFVKQGAGSLIVNSATSGNLLRAGVSGGTLRPVGNALGATDVTVSPGGTLAYGTAGAPGTATLFNLNLAGGAVEARVGTTSDALTVSETLNISAPTVLRAVPVGPVTGTLPLTFPVITYNTLTGSLANLTFASGNPHVTGTVVNDATAKQISVQINAADSLVWKGNVNANWNVNTTANFALASNGTTASNFFDFDGVRFDDTGLASSTVTLVGNVQPSFVQVANTTGTYTFQGAPITGPAGLTKTGAGNLVFLGNNSYAGSTSLTGGLVTVGNGATTGSLGFGPIALTDTTLTINRSDAVNIGSPISGNGSLVKNGAGTLALAAVNSFTGGTIINQGLVSLNAGGAIGTLRGVVTVNAGATLQSNAIDSLGYNADGTQVTTLNLNGGTYNSTVTGNQGYTTNFVFNGGTSTGGVLNFNTGFGITSVASSTVSTIASGISIRGSNLTVNVAAGTVPGGIDLNVSGIIIGGDLRKRS